MNQFRIFPLAQAHLFCIASYVAAAFLAAFDGWLSLIPLALFLLISVSAPFLHRWSYYLPIKSRGVRTSKEVAITFDDGPDPLLTPLILDLLNTHTVKATFFVKGNHAERYPEIIRSILAAGNTIGNHSYSHTPRLMLKSSRDLRNDICAAQKLLVTFGIYPLAFRPLAGITNPKLWKILIELGMYCVNFSCRAFDVGNRRIANLSQRILKKVRGGDIILLHDRAPKKMNDVPIILKHIDQLLTGIKAKGLKIVPLNTITSRPTMIHVRKQSPITDIPLSHILTIRKAHPPYTVASYDPSLYSAILNHYTPEKKLLLVSETSVTIPLPFTHIKPSSIFSFQGTFDTILLHTPLLILERDLIPLFRSLYGKISPGGALYCTVPLPSLKLWLQNCTFSFKHGIFPYSRSLQFIKKSFKKAGFSTIQARIEPSKGTRFARIKVVMPV